MHAYWTLMRRELAGFFCSMTGYIVIAAVTFLVGLIFVAVLNQLGNEALPKPVTELMFSTFWFWIVLPLVIPAITMRLFALEKSTGTFETLMTTPISDIQVVAAKFTAALVFYMIMWAPLLPCLMIIRHFANQPGTLDAGTVCGMYLGLFLIGGLLISIGCFASALSRSQVTAAIITLVLGVALLLIGYLGDQVPTNSWQSQVLSFFNLAEQVQDFVRGVVDTRIVIFYSTTMAFFLFLTLRTVESRHWK
jgi:ABC-2 type transport system permease protein